MKRHSTFGIQFIEHRYLKTSRSISGCLHFSRIRLMIALNLILWITITGFSQDIAQTSLTWKVNYLNDQASQQSLPYACSFKTNGSQDILWMQRNGQFTSTLNVSGLNGSWANIDSVGTVSYSITSGTESGSIAFERTIEGIFVYLTLSQSTAQSLSYKFSVSEVTPTN